MKPGELESDPGSVEDFWTTGREEPKKLHLSPPLPPEPSFPPISLLLLVVVLMASAEESDGAGLRPNQFLRLDFGEE